MVTNQTKNKRYFVAAVIVFFVWSYFGFFNNSNKKSNENNSDKPVAQVIEQASKKEDVYKKSVGSLRPNFTEKSPHENPIHPFLNLKKQNEARLVKHKTVKERLKTISYSSAVKINERPYYIASARAGLAYANNSIYNLAGYSIVKSESALVTDLILDFNSKPVVVNSKNLSFGIVTGTIIVKLKEIEIAESLAQQFGFEILFSDADTATVYFKAPEGISILNLILSLKKSNFVINAEIEIIENTKVAK